MHICQGASRPKADTLSMFRILRPVSSLDIPSDGWLSVRNESDMIKHTSSAKSSVCTLINISVSKVAFDC